ncbi:MAG TPA: hypothetical protein VIF62_31070 [Labilithrix sp.]|jgi:hypothetical protein
MRGRRALLVVVALAAPLGATQCGSGGGTDAPSDAAAPIDQAAALAAIAALQTKYCTAFQRCDPTDFARQYGTVEACSRVEDAPIVNFAGNWGYYTEAGALANQLAYGTTLTPASIEACTAALDLSSCTSVARMMNESVAPPECRGLYFGTLPAGAPCMTNNQCESGRCFTPIRAEINACGACIPELAVGDICQYGTFICPDGSLCQPKTPGSNDAVCKKFGDVGAPCDAVTLCHFDLVCENGVCATPPADDACAPGVPAIDVLAPWLGRAGCPIFPGSRYCDPNTNKCTPMPLANLGESCGQTSGPPFFVGCLAGIACTAVVGDASPRQYTCEPHIPLGSPCVPGDFTYEVQKCATGVCFELYCREHGPAQCSAPEVAP